MAQVFAAGPRTSARLCSANRASAQNINGYTSKLCSTGASGLIIVVSAYSLTIHHFGEKERPNVGIALAASRAPELDTQHGRSEVWIQNLFACRTIRATMTSTVGFSHVRWVEDSTPE